MGQPIFSLIQVCKNSIQNVCRKVLKTSYNFFRYQNFSACVPGPTVQQEDASGSFFRFYGKCYSQNVVFVNYHDMSRLSFIWILRHFSGKICFLFTGPFRSFWVFSPKKISIWFYNFCDWPQNDLTMPEALFHAHKMHVVLSC